MKIFEGILSFVVTMYIIKYSVDSNFSNTANFKSSEFIVIPLMAIICIRLTPLMTTIMAKNISVHNTNDLLIYVQTIIFSLNIIIILILSALNRNKFLLGRVIEQDRLSTIGTLAAGISHEINNPPAIILSSNLLIKNNQDVTSSIERIQ